MKLLLFLADKHNLHTKNKFMLIFMMIGMSIGMGLGSFFIKENPQLFAIGQGFGITFGVLIGIIIDTKIQKENRQIPIALNDNIQEK